MNLVLTVSIVLCAAATGVLMLVLHQVSVAGRRLPVTAEWIDDLSIERYRPMLRLLDSRDLEFLSAQPGFTPRMAGLLRAQRCQVFRGYLRCLSADFSRICGAMKLLMLHARRDRPDLATALVRNQVLFAAGLIVVQCRLLLFQAGLCTVDVNGLVRIFDAMRIELRTLVPSTAGAGA